MLVINSGDVLSETLALTGNGVVSNMVKSFLIQEINNLPYPLAEHVKTPLNGAAAKASIDER